MGEEDVFEEVEVDLGEENAVLELDVVLGEEEVVLEVEVELREDEVVLGEAEVVWKNRILFLKLTWSGHWHKNSTILSYPQTYPIGPICNIIDWFI